jgi:hypothetical protein
VSRLLRLFPKAWRATYGDEVADMLTSSDRPWSDRLDLVRAGVGMRTDQLIDQLQGRTMLMRSLRVIAVGLAALGLGGAVWATPQLAHGVGEIPMHWWSSLAVLPLAAGIVLAVVAWRPRRHDRPT